MIDWSEIRKAKKISLAHHFILDLNEGFISSFRSFRTSAFYGVVAHAQSDGLLVRMQLVSFNWWKDMSDINSVHCHLVERCASSDSYCNIHMQSISPNIFNLIFSSNFRAATLLIISPSVHNYLHCNPRAL